MSEIIKIISNKTIIIKIIIDKLQQFISGILNILFGFIINLMIF